MARRHKNARPKPYRRRTRVKPNPRVVLIPTHKKQDDGMSPGRLVAIAEWREAR
ncbi:MAG TPA: hypothetical protein VFF25_02770 [Clostridia bacterium]|nr:hypothetical protein [Clostridia bacterium]